MKAKQLNRAEDRGMMMITHLSEARTIPFNEFKPDVVLESIQEHLADFEYKLNEHVNCAKAAGQQIKKDAMMMAKTAGFAGWGASSGGATENYLAK